MTSIIIPAHNEERTIQRGITPLIHGLEVNKYEIIVVCNGCTDKTENIVRDLSDKIKIVSTEIPSKIHALNLGDRNAKGFPRIYLDADILIAENDLDKVISILEKDSILAAAPMIKYDLSESSLFVRLYYRVWLKSAYFSTNVIGSGFYGLSRSGRERFKEFPNITADDEFVRLLFSEKERMVAENASFTVFPPKDLKNLIKIKSRSFFGNMELKNKYPDLFRNKESNKIGMIRNLKKDPVAFLLLPYYWIIKKIIISKAKGKILSAFRGDHIAWERDESTRINLNSTRD